MVGCVKIEMHKSQMTVRSLYSDFLAKFHMGNMKHRTLLEVQKSIQKAYSVSDNWRVVGGLFGITAGTARRIAVEGHEPVDHDIRVALGLPALIPAPACLKCGEVHVTKRCMNGEAGRKTPRRVAIRCDSMISAAGTILRNLEPEQVKELVRLLEVRDDGKQLS
jgi:hypothetical protein